jgi:hypothetical protein
MLSNGMGGIDLGKGLDHAVAYFGVVNVRGLIDRLRVIRNHLADKGAPATAPAQGNGPRELRPGFRNSEG